MTIKKTVVLTSKENFVWSSMQEIIPHLERCWQKSKDDEHSVVLCNVERAPLKTIVKEVSTANNVVMTCFNHRLAKTIMFLRGDLRFNFRIFFHLHNQATIALWPLQTFGNKHFFNSSDIFISSCKRDQQALKVTIANALSSVVPFALADEETKKMQSAHSFKSRKEFYYVGRISRQKNLHELLLAFSELIKEGLETHLHIYGKEDFLGSPNMGQIDTSYKSVLDEIVKKCQLESHVSFHGMKDRDELYAELNAKYIFVSPSAHSDENFGMAAYRALLRGEQVVLSDWGGHSMFADFFPGQVRYIDVIHKNSSLGVDVTELSKVLKEAYSSEPITIEPFAFEEEKIALDYRNLALSSEQRSEDVIYTDVAKAIFEKKSKLLDTDTKIFSGYSDPLAIPFFKAYGLKL